METLLSMKDFKGIRLIHIQLGPACNMQCRHCHQTPEKNVKGYSLNDVSEDTLEFLSHYIEFSQKKEFIDEAEKDGTVFKVEFYGGEPLLHWDLIKDTVRYFENKYHFLNNKSFRFGFITNGLGLTQDVVDFVNKHDIKFSLSYDAPYPWAVRGYVPDKIIALANQINNLQIVCCGCAYNCDPDLAFRCLVAKFPNTRDYIIRTEVMRTFPELDEDVDNYNEEKLRTSIRKIFIGAKAGNIFLRNYAKKILKPLFAPEDYCFHSSGGIMNCVCGKKEMTIGLDGKVPFCYNDFRVIGTLKGSTLKEVNGKATKVWLDTYDPECSHCECKDLCYWSCIISLRDEKKHMPICEKYRKPFFKIVKEEMKRLTEPLTQEEVDWYKEQIQLMNEQVQKFLEEPSRYEKEHTRLPNELFA